MSNRNLSEEDMFQDPNFSDHEDELSRSNEEQDQDLADQSDMDEQHTQKVNGQLESLQLRVEELSQALYNEKQVHNETKLKKQMDEQIYHEKLLMSQQMIEELNEKVMTLNFNPSDSLRLEIIKYCNQISLSNIDITTQEITNETIIAILNESAKKINSNNNNNSGSATIPHSHRNSNGSTKVPSAYLQNEFSKFCLKISLQLSDEGTAYTDEKCSMILQKASKLIVENTTKVKNLESELHMSFNSTEDIRALKTKLIQLVERLRIEKDMKIKAENETTMIKKKLELLSDHIEKLMTHLKHEATSKLRLTDQLRTSEREFLTMKESCEAIQKKSNARDRLIIELREGSKILEDQLRLMDEKYLELRSKLDWAREVHTVRLRKAEKKATELRVKYALSMNGNAILDNIPLPDIYSRGGSGMFDNSNGIVSNHHMSMNANTNINTNSSIFPTNDRISTANMSMMTTGSSSSNSRRSNRNTHTSSISRGSSKYQRSIHSSSSSGHYYHNNSSNNNNNNNDELQEHNQHHHHQLTSQPSMDNVLEKLRIQENKKREWTEEKMRKLVESR